MPDEKSSSRKRVLMYAIGFLFSLSCAIPAYVNSSFLSEFIGEGLVGIVYTASSILAIAAFIEMPSLIRRLGNWGVTLGLLFLGILSLLGLAAGQGSLSVISAFILNFVAIALVNFTLDVFLEEFSPDSKTGKIRGAYLTIANTAWLVSPSLASVILGEGAFMNIYATSALLLVPVIALIFANLRKVPEPQYGKAPFWKSFGEVWSDRNVKGILLLQFLLQFFYAWMIIYTPIYLHQTVGFDWPTIGVIFTIMLLPFVLLEALLGRLADRDGEKTMLSAGFAVIALSTLSLAFISGTNPVIWAAALFMTRVGAATIEIMTDTYFFKKVDASKTHVISFFRTARPLAYVIGPIIATILLTVFDIKGLFVFLGFLMLYGLRYTLTLEDVK